MIVVTFLNIFIFVSPVFFLNKQKYRFDFLFQKAYYKKAIKYEIDPSKSLWIFFFTRFCGPSIYFFLLYKNSSMKNGLFE